MAKQYNVNIIGNLTNNDGVLSGFSASNYAKLNKSFQPSSASWEIVFKINTGNTPSGAIFGNTGFTYQNAPQVGINGDSKFQIYVPANDSQYGGHNIVDGATGTHTVLANTTYWIKLYFTGSEYVFDYSLDGETYINDYSYTSSTIMYQPNVTFNIGYNSWDVSSVDFFTGTIDLNESYIKVNGVTWWRGVTNTTTIQLRHDTASNWSTVNPTLAEGEVGIETDTRKQKIGDGSTAWNSLAYDLGSTALQSIASSDVLTALGYTPVNKTGDTMSGNLVISTDNAYNESLSLKNTFINKNSAPSTNSFTWLPFKDANDAIVAGMYLRDTTNERELRLRVDSRDGNNDGFCIGYDANNVAYTSCPQSDVANSIVTTIAKSKSQNGYYKLGNGLIIQWGFLSQVSAPGSILFPTAFSSATSYSITSGVATSGASIYFSSASSTGINYTASTAKKDYYWIAVGY